MAKEVCFTDEIKLLYFIGYRAHKSKVRTFILQFYLNTLSMNKVDEFYLPNIVRMKYFSIIFNEKSVHSTRKNTVFGAQFKYHFKKVKQSSLINPLI